MRKNPGSNPSPTVWDGFGATLIHDMGKVGELTSFADRRLRKGHGLSHAKDLAVMLEAAFKAHCIPGPPKVPPDWYEFVHPPSGVDRDAIQLAHKLADQISKQMQGEAYSRLEDPKWLAELERIDKGAREKLRRHNLPTHFYPYFGTPKEWQSNDGDGAFHTICRGLSNDLTLPLLLSIQESVKDFPHTRYVPHLSLKLHDMFAASLFYFVYRKLREIRDPCALHEFAVYAIEVTPDLFDVFYRLRDILACSRYAREYYQQSHLHLFAPWGADLPGLSADHNPFVFYESQGFVFLYPDFETARAGLLAALDSVPLLRKVEIRCTRFGVDLKYSGAGWERGAARTGTFVESLPAPSLAEFLAAGGERCQTCQRVVSLGELTEDDKGNLQCMVCHATRKASSGIDLDLVSRSGSGSDRIAYIFVTLPPDLRTHAAQVAETSLIPEFWAEHQLPSALQPPATEQHIYEYLQALLAIREFDAALVEGVEVIRRESGQTAALILFQNPASKAIVTHEDYFWELVDFVHAQKRKLHLECSLRAVICPPKTPFWSLVEMATQYCKGDFLWDVSKEAVHMFSEKEIESIRNLAKECQKYRMRTQLNFLSGVALQTSLEELTLEIDYRSDRLKELRNPLRQAVCALEQEGSELKDREKRAVFLKYVAGLTR